ncbi:MAG: methyltransferase domain-containing protein [Chthoniobacterales bacterium]|nr:methyltransferase domain-containing protein [Chthoniobacterales bacterium]
MSQGMSAILFRRFLADPLKIAYVVPSSRKLVGRVLRDMDFTKAKTFVEFGGGEGCYTREVAKRLGPDARLLVFELDPHLAEHLRNQFRDDERVIICQSDAAGFRDELAKLGLRHADYVISGIPFSYIPPRKKKEILHAVHDGLSPDGMFVVYQVTMELKGHGRMFAACEVEYFLANIPPMFVLAFHKSELTLRKPQKRKKRREQRQKAAA